ncbi:MAG: cob(I)yrinic acid a,c-diamide adenosyltransferase [Planctomycetota bacterium]|nr:cob(I)yrinic acid a,c-diamide adenosyltransferase [Planctomycetota bacterium]MDA1212217.1 cob(I)yrinic acid a,c-diamide adenosyltransferase [Planctomycetota bacterium]
MVYLNRIYTRTGDEGETSLGDGTRVKKTHNRIAAYGTVDELNSILGVVLVTPLDETMSLRLKRIQNDLFDVGADLCVPEKRANESTGETSTPSEPLRVTADQVTALERWIDEATDRLEPLRSFVLPGGSVTSAYLHLARTVCRRAEIAVLALADAESVNAQVAIYLNRLSDLLFVWSRLANDEGRGDVLWIPGQNREQPV